MGGCTILITKFSAPLPACPALSGILAGKLENLDTIGMDLNEIKQLINSNDEKIILIEDEKPVLVLMSFEGYRKNFSIQRIINQKVKNNSQGETQTNKSQEGSQSELKLEDLPF